MKNNQNEYYFCTSIKIKNGRIIYAKDYGKKAFKIRLNK